MNRNEIHLLIMRGLLRVRRRFSGAPTARRKAHARPARCLRMGTAFVEPTLTFSLCPLSQELGHSDTSTVCGSRRIIIVNGLDLPPSLSLPISFHPRPPSHPSLYITRLIQASGARAAPIPPPPRSVSFSVAARYHPGLRRSPTGSSPAVFFSAAVPERAPLRPPPRCRRSGRALWSSASSRRQPARQRTVNVTCTGTGRWHWEG